MTDQHRANDVLIVGPDGTDPIECGLGVRGEEKEASFAQRIGLPLEDADDGRHSGEGGGPGLRQPARTRRRALDGQQLPTLGVEHADLDVRRLGDRSQGRQQAGQPIGVDGGDRRRDADRITGLTEVADPLHFQQRHRLVGEQTAMQQAAIKLG